VSVLLGLASGLSWGVADFFGGLQSRKVPALAVALWSQVAGGITLLAVLGIVGGLPPLPGVFWGAGAGLFSGMAVAMFYRALAAGVMSVVAPISACGAAVPVVVGLFGGRVPTGPQGIGLALVFCGIVLVSLATGGSVKEPREEGSSVGRLTVPTLILALGSAAGFGAFYVLVDAGSAAGGSPLWTIAGARAGSLCVLLTAILAAPRSAPWPGAKRMPSVAAVGVLDTTANALFAFAAAAGNLAVAAVLGSMYPVATALLGRVLLGEQLSLLQAVGVVFALVGVVLVSIP
jgi:drug/metabolite transporter (DMT)-like permease